MKILHINTAQSWRGGEAQTYMLIERLLSRKVDCELAAQPDCPLARKTAELGAPVHGVAMRGELDIKAIFALRKTITRGGFDAVHAHTAHAHGLAAAALIGKSAPPLVVTRRFEAGYKKNLLSRWKYHRCGMIIAISRAIKDLLAAQGISEKKLALVYSGVDLTRAHTISPLDLHHVLALPASAVLCGTVGALTPEKGHQWLLPALTKCIHASVTLHTCFIGEGPLSALLQEKARKYGIGPNVHFLGFQAEPLPYLAALDFFCMPSLREGLGSSILDAMLLGKPVIGSRTGGIPEVVQDAVTGYLVDPGDSETLADRIMQLTKDESLRKRMGAAGKNRITAFNIDHTADQTAAVYRQLSAGCTP